jgi:hypothetical protein
MKTKFAASSFSQLLSAALCLQATPLALAQSIPPASSICKSTSFGTYGTLLRPNASRYECREAPPASRPTQTELFWIPARYMPVKPIVPSLTPATCKSTPAQNALTGDIMANMNESRPAIQSLTLVNVDPSRKLWATGTSRADILVGSPNTSDILNGGMGRNTYVVGGLATVLLGSGDRSIGASTLSEADKTELGLDAELIHISTTLQTDPGNLETSSGGLVPVRGAGSVTSFLPGPDDCTASSTWLQHTAPLAFEQLAFNIPKRSSVQSDAPNPLAQLLPPRNTPGITGGAERGEALRGCLEADCSGVDSPTSQLDIPGTPTLVGFQPEGSKADRISISAAGLSFQGTPIDQLFPRGRTIPVLLVDRVRLARTAVVSPERLRLLTQRAEGLTSVRSTVAPLVYFRRSGLLVLSRNSEPLGSKRNPGLVIARLLNQRKKPLDLQASGNQLYQARFLIFQPQLGTTNGQGLREPGPQGTLESLPR